MAVNLSGLSKFTTSANALSGLILVTPQTVQGYQPQPKTQPNGQTQQQPPSLLFHYEGEQSVQIQSDITDHYVEDNTAVQDQIALRPEIITTQGFIGELNNVTPYGLQTLKTIADKLVDVNAYLPAWSTSALIAYNNAFQLYQVGVNAYNSAVSSWSSVTGGIGTNVIGSSGIQNYAFNPNTGKVQNNQNKQQLAFQQFYGYWRNRTLFTVQTPWAIFENMAIMNLRAVQDAETRVISTFEVSFKMIRQAKVAYSDPIDTNMQNRASMQAGGLNDLGVSTPVSDIGVKDVLTSNYPGSVAV